MITTKCTAGNDRVSLKLVEKAGFYEFLIDSAVDDLPPNAGKLFRFFARHSIGWGRKSLTATWGQLEEGMRAPEETRWPWLRKPIGMARSSFFAALAVLKEKGLVRVSQNDRGVSVYEINMDWRAGDDEMSIAESVSYYARRHQDENRSPESRTSYNAGLNDPKKKERREEAPSLRSAPVSPIGRKGELGSGKEEALPPFARAPLPPAGLAHPNTNDTASAYIMTLKRAWDDTYPDEQCPIFDVRDYVVLPGVLKARLYDNVPARHDFLDFVVRNWSQIMAARFGWMRQPPPSRPALRFICQRAFVTTLLDAYADRRHWDQIRMLPAEEQELARLMEGGMGREEAIAKVAEHRALSKMRDEKADVGRHNADMTRQAEAARKKLNDDRRAFMREKAIASCETRPRTAPSRIGHQHAKPRTPVSEPPRRPAVPIAPVDDFANLPPIDLPELPPFDPAAWN